MSAATDLMVTLAKIQAAQGAKRASMVAEARAKFGKVQWSSPALRNWARAAFNEGIKQ